MKEIKRYEVVSVDGVPAHRLSQEGRWVKYDDKEAIVTEKDAHIAALQEQVRALTTERDASRKAIADIYKAVIGGRPGWSNWDAYLDDIVEEVSTALHEIRAQGVEEFAEDCKVKAVLESRTFWTDVSSSAEEFAAAIRAGEQP